MPSIFDLAVQIALSCTEYLTVHVVLRQILMSVLYPQHAPEEHAQTQGVPSRVSYVNLVSESLKMDSSVMVRLEAVFVQNVFFFMCTGVCAPPDLALIANKVAVEGKHAK